MKCLAIAVLAASLGFWSGSADARSAGGSLNEYLASMSVPMRVSVVRVNTVRHLIDAWIAQGDPPYLGEIGKACANVNALRADMFIAIAPPSSLRTTHGWVAKAYADTRSGCRAVRQLALAARDAARGPTVRPSQTWLAAQHDLRRFAGTNLDAFAGAVHRWRLAVFRYAAARGADVPEWVSLLG
jgi:hypothetical protein